jgi:L-rhamnonate dehydratase
LTGAILVQIRTKEGITGYGMGGGGAAACHIIDTHLKRMLIGADATNIELLWDQLFASTSFYGRRGVVVQAMSGIDLALWDIAGKRAGLPVYRLLGSQYRDRVPGYYTGNDVEHGLKLGFRAVKLANFKDSRAGSDGMGANVQHILEGRQRIGKDSLLMLDALCAWDVPYTIELAERVAEARLYFLEEPILPDDVDGYTRLCKEVRSTRIASGEHEATIYGFRELLRNHAAHILQPDLTWSGGLTDARRVAAAAEAAGVPLIPHRGGSIYGMTLLLTTRTASLAESFGTGDSGNEIMELLTPKLVDGHYLAPTGPGFGVEFSDRVLRAYAPQLI